MFNVNTTIINMAMYVLSCSTEDIDQFIYKGILLDVVNNTAEWLGDYYYEDLSGNLYKRYKAANTLAAMLRGEYTVENNIKEDDVIASVFEHIITSDGDCSHESVATEASVLDIISHMFDQRLIIASNSYIHALMGNDKNAMTYRLKVLPDRDTNGIFVVLGREMAEVTPLNRHLVVENGVMTDFKGCDVNVKRMFQWEATMEKNLARQMTRQIFIV